MDTKAAVQGDEGDRREMRAIFSETGHRTLNALLIVSGGATVSFMTFLGAAVQQPELATRVGSAATQYLADAMKFFFQSLLYAVLSHGTTYASHAGHHYSATFSHSRTASNLWHGLGLLFMGITIVVCALSFWYLLRGGLAAIDAFELIGDALAKGRHTPPQP